MGPLKLARPSAPQAVFCLADMALQSPPRRNHLLLTPYGRFLGSDDNVYVVASPLAVAAAAAAAVTTSGHRDPPVTHAVISDWTQLEFEVRAGLRESPASPDEDLEELPDSLASRRRRSIANALRRHPPIVTLSRSPTASATTAPTAAPTAAAAAATPTAATATPATTIATPTAASLQIVPVCGRDFLLFVQSFAVIMSTVMLIKNAVGAAVFESLEL